MTLVGLLTLLLLVVGGVWSVVITSRGKGLRARILGTLLGLVVLAHTLPLVAGVDRWSLGGPGAAGDWADLPVALMVLFTLALLGRIQARSQALETQLGGHLAYLDRLFETMGEALLLLDRQGRVLRANPAFRGMFGYPPEALAGRSAAEVMVPQDLGEEARRFTERVVGGEQIHRTTVRLRHDGTPVDVSILGGPVEVPESAVGGFLLFRDITRQTEVEGTFRHFEKALEQTQVGVTITDLRGIITYTNPADAEMHGYSVEELIGRDVRIFAPPDLANPMDIETLLSMGRWGRETLNCRRDGTQFPVQLLSDLVRNAAGEPIGVVTTCQDISERKLAEQTLRESEERYALALRGASEGLWDWNLETYEVYYSSLWKSMLGFDDGEVGSGIGEWLDRVHPEDTDRVTEALRNHRDGVSTRMEVEHRIRLKDGEYRWFLVRGIADRGPDGNPYRIAGSLSDIEERKLHEEQLAHHALYDLLTGLPNRAYFSEVLDRAFARRARHPEQTFAVLFLDVDRFKLVNDSLGHAAGDELLRQVGQRLRETIRPGDVAARLAGDEFCVLVNEIQEFQDATRVARRVQTAFRDPLGIDGREVVVSLSIGIAVSQPDAPDAPTLLRHADSAMYRAKAGGDGSVEVFDRGMHDHAMYMMRLEQDLRSALESQQFHLVYQPVVELGTESLAGLEALLRWTHPHRGDLGPEEFIDIAEETGLIVPIGRWVLDRAIGEMAAWMETFPGLREMAVSVNVSHRQLLLPDFVGEVRAALERHRLPPRNLQLEISEQFVMSDADRNARVIRDLRGLGVKVQLDDFGTGPTSLTYLDRLRVDSLKIDRTFISSMGFPEGREGMVESMITLARDLDMHTTAEGIETADQSARLLRLRCQRGQGFLFSRPLSHDAMTEYLGRDGLG